MKLINVPGSEVQVGDRVADKSGVFRHIYSSDVIVDKDGNLVGARAANLGNRALLVIYSRAIYTVLREQ